jgi:hypothetical protein
MDMPSSMIKEKHLCHWPGCEREVDPRLWGCKSHWFRLPKPLRDEIWRTYRPGQEITKDPSREYVIAIKAVRDWALDQIEKEKKA